MPLIGVRCRAGQGDMDTGTRVSHGWFLGEASVRISQPWPQHDRARLLSDLPLNSDWLMAGMLREIEALRRAPGPR